MTELLSFLSTVSWPGVAATGILTLSHCYRAWLATRRASFRLRGLQIDARSTEELLLIMKEQQRLRASSRPRPSFVDSGGEKSTVVGD
ncbi:hypothetical protein PZN02_005279 [Sinorhizobium garamanticum]|uniref:Uncharacterized protein n=1 Tax=Sinorhizobium garamanticum TaxID=680247 RepID=A0ABY8DJT0_9HYPH|nr:hypothetical protein [Sinorhizobium garamanticum]WEX89942.1 hypothetical protein PZN02_005279 [Sinorhizobium garamanticum]